MENNELHTKSYMEFHFHIKLSSIYLNKIIFHQKEKRKKKKSTLASLEYSIQHHTLFSLNQHMVRYGHFCNLGPRGFRGSFHFQLVPVWPPLCLHALQDSLVQLFGEKRKRYFAKKKKRIEKKKERQRQLCKECLEGFGYF